MRQTVSLEQDYEAIKAAKAEVELQLSEVTIQLSDCQEAKDAAKHGKRVVEDQMKAVAVQNSSLTAEVTI